MSTTAKARRSTKRVSKPALLPLHHKSEDKEAPPEKTFILPADKNLLELTSRDDYQCILKDIQDRAIVFEFFAHWCGPCKMLTAKLNEIAEEYKGKLLIVKIDVDEYEDLAVEQNVSAIPTFMIWKNKRMVKMFSNSNVELLEQTLEKYVEKPEKVEGE